MPRGAPRRRKCQGGRGEEGVHRDGFPSKFIEKARFSFIKESRFHGTWLAFRGCLLRALLSRSN
eukprot:639449-Pyramimonas_sp.AAC.1